MLCVLTPLMFAYFSGAFGIDGQPFSRLLRKTTITEFTVMSFVCFIRAAEVSVPELFLPSRLRALQNEGSICANERVLIPLSRKIKVTL